MALDAINRITIDVSDPLTTPVVRAVQEDIRSRYVEITLVRNGTPLDIPAGAYGMIGMRRADGTYCLYDYTEDETPAVTISGNVVTIYLSQAALSVAGPLYTSVSLYSPDGQTKLTAFAFTVSVEAVAVPSGAVPSTYINILEGLVADAVDAANRAEEAAAQVGDPVSYTAQTKTEAQKAQARTNIGAASTSSASTSAAGIVQLYDGVDSSSATLAATAAAKAAYDKGVEAYNKSLKYYKSVTELGLTSGSATIAGAFAAMENNSIAWLDAAQFANGQTPNSYGFVEIQKVGDSRASIFFWGKASDNGDYRMGINSSDVPDGTWVKIPNGNLFLGSSYDLNDLRGSGATGFYEIGQNLPNSPASWCWMMVIGGIGTIQIAFAPTKIYIRAYTGNPLAWTAWKSITLS